VWRDEPLQFIAQSDLPIDAPSRASTFSLAASAVQSTRCTQRYRRRGGSHRGGDEAVGGDQQLCERRG
jgi:hypothetical protein